MYTKEILVDGMTCDHCVQHVTDELTSIEGVTDVAITLTPDGSSPVTITASAEISEAAIAAAIDEAGYTIAS